MPIEVRLKAVETLLFRSDVVAVGKFRCAHDHPLFHDSGPCSHHSFVFPRMATAIQHDGRPEFVATPGSVVFYNEGQRYRRRRISAIDASDWYAVADDVLVELLTNAGEKVGRDRAPFRAVNGVVAPGTFLAQRSLFDRLERGAVADALEVEESVLAVLRDSVKPVAREQLRRRDRDSVEAVRELLARDPARSQSLRSLAHEVDMTPYRLCRAFHLSCGETLTSFRHSLRLSLALESLRDPDVDLTRLALDLGYSSHSHFTARFRRHFGVPPSTVRAILM